MAPGPPRPRSSTSPISGREHPPALAWSEKRAGKTVIHGAGRTSTPVPNSLDAFAPMGSGFVIQTAGNRPVTTRWVAADGTCSVMLRSGVARWSTCDNRFSDISTDNARVLGLPSYGDGLGPTTLDILSTDDGSVARTFRAPTHGAVTTYVDEVWEDAEHVLVVTYSDGEWAIVRLGLDGSMEYAVTPRGGSSDVRAPFQLQTR